MRTFGKIIIGLIFILLFLILVLAGTIRFGLLNKSFIFGAFEKNNVYTQLPAIVSDYLSYDADFSEQERAGYAGFAKNIPPKIVKPLIEDNLSQVFDYLNGQSKNIVISLSIPGVGFQDSSSFRWSPSQIPNQDLRERIKLLNGASDTLIAAGFIILAILIGLFFFYGMLSTPMWLLDGKTLLLSSGIFVIIVSLLSKLVLLIITTELINGLEISQKLLGLLLSSLFPDITTAWLATGGILILLWLTLSFFRRNLVE